MAESDSGYGKPDYYLHKVIVFTEGLFSAIIKIIEIREYEIATK